MSLKLSISLIIIASLFLTGCAATVNSNIQNPQKKLSINDKVAFLDTMHLVPENASKIGSSQFGDSMFSTDCSFDSNLVEARKIARANGANIVKVTEKKSPDFLSSCYRLKIDYYYYDGNVANLAQHQLQIN